MLWIHLRSLVPRSSYSPPSFFPQLIKWTPVLTALLLPALIFGCSKASPQTTSKRSLPSEFIAGSFVVTMSVTANESDLDGLSADVGEELGCHTSKPQKIDWGSHGSGLLSAQLASTFNIRYENCDFSRAGTKHILEKLASSTNVAAVEAEASVATTPLMENDPGKSEQGHLRVIKRDKACEAARQNSRPIIVAVVDTGIDTDHPDLREMIYRDVQGVIVGANFVGSGATMPPDGEFTDHTGHGTHVAGLIAAAANNSLGVVGVASCANIKLMPVRVLGDNGKGTSIEIDRGVKWAVDHGAEIINMSLGYTGTSSSPTPSFYRPLYANLVAQDVLIFAAAGNDGYVNGSFNDEGEYQFSYPASFDNVISVAATNGEGNLTSFSNRGPRVDLAAPGSMLLSTIPMSYGRKSGTSMATPVAVGAYALALASAQAGIQQAGMQEIRRVDSQEALALLLDSTLSGQPLPPSLVKSGGVIDVEKLVKKINARFPLLANDTATPTQPTNSVFVSQPTSTQPQKPAQPEELLFLGLADGGHAGWPQSLKITSVPKDTSVVYFYWGGGSYFTKAYVGAGQEERGVEDRDDWIFYGNRSLKAVAYSRSGKILATKTMRLRGF